MVSSSCVLASFFRSLSFSSSSSSSSSSFLSLFFSHCLFLFDIPVTGAAADNLLRANEPPLSGVASDDRRSRSHACRRDTI